MIIMTSSITNWLPALRSYRPTVTNWPAKLPFGKRLWQSVGIAFVSLHATIRFVIDEQGLDDAVGLEFVSVYTDKKGEEKIYKVRPFKMVAKEGNLYTFECNVEPDHAGSFKTAIRMYPKNDNLPHRQDFCYVKWL